MPGLAELLARWQDDPAFRRNVTRWEKIPAQEGAYAGFPSFLDPRLQETLRRRGVERLYCHQAAAIEATGRGKNVVVVTPTASGKTLCYNIPVVNEFLNNRESRALYPVSYTHLDVYKRQLYHREIKAAADPEKFKEEKIKSYNEMFLNPNIAAECGYIDEVIDPDDTRKILFQSLALLIHKKSTRRLQKKHGNIPL